MFPLKRGGYGRNKKVFEKKTHAGQILDFSFFVVGRSPDCVNDGAKYK